MSSRSGGRHVFFLHRNNLRCNNVGRLALHPDRPSYQLTPKSNDSIAYLTVKAKCTLLSDESAYATDSQQYELTGGPAEPYLGISATRLLY